MFGASGQEVIKLKNQLKEKSEQLAVQQRMFADLQVKYNDTKVKFKKMQMEWVKWQQENAEPADKRELHERIMVLSDKIKEKDEANRELQQQLQDLKSENARLNNEIEMQRENLEQILRIEYEEKFQKRKDNIIKETELYKEEMAKEVKEISNELEKEKKKRIEAENALNIFWDDNK